mgnify:FL=1
MSVEKVNKYKEEKANRKEILAKQKKKAKAAKVGLITGGIVIVALIAVAIGVTIRNERVAYLNSLPDYNTTSMALGDLSSVLSTEAPTGTDESGAAGETETAGEEETAAEETAAQETESAAEETAAGETETAAEGTAAQGTTAQETEAATESETEA